MRIALLILLCCVPARADDQLLLLQSGEVPIVLSAPHGGHLPIPGVEPRQDRQVPGFVTTGDLYTAQLAERVAQGMQRRGARPYLVVAGFHRRYLDANRPLQAASESPAAAALYQQYHGALAGHCAEVKRRWGAGLVVDFHGQKADPEAIFRGTKNGATVASLLHRHGSAGVVGPQSLLGVLAALGYRIVPTELAVPENQSFEGGYIVQTYGGGPVDAIQLELGRHLRDPQRQDRTADDIASALVTFLQAYLAPSPR